MQEQGIIVTPEELYYLGNVMHAEYIDYAYISAMGDIEKNRAIYESTAAEGLSRKGILEEDFSGNQEISLLAEELLSPVFFGGHESEAKICLLGEEAAVYSFQYHFSGKDQITRVIKQDKNWDITSCERQMVKEDIMPYLPQQGETETVFQPDRVSEIIVLKNMQIGESAAVRVVFCCGSSLFVENEKEEIIALSQENFQDMISEILLFEGGDYGI